MGLMWGIYYAFFIRGSLEIDFENLKHFLNNGKKLKDGI